MLKGFILFALSGIFFYHSGYTHASLNYEKEIKAKEVQYNNYIDSVKKEFLEKEKRYKDENVRILLAFNSAKKQYDSDINNIKLAYSSQLQQSNDRAEIYKRKAESGSNSCRELAIYTGRLDKSLTESRELVKELRGVIEYNSRQIKNLTAYINNIHRTIE